MKRFRSLMGLGAAFLATVTVSSVQATPDPENLEVIAHPTTGDPMLLWQGQPGRTYFIQISDPNYPLEEWFWGSEIELGDGGTIDYEIDSNAPRAFFRLWNIEAQPPVGVTPEDWDADNDGLPNAVEISEEIQTNPVIDDTDGDGLKDGFEVNNGLDPHDDDGDDGAAGMPDADGWTNLQEQSAGTDPNDWDTDGDGLADDADSSPTDNNAVADPDGENLDVNTGIIGRWDFEKLDTSGKLASEPQSTGGCDIANTLASWDGQTAWTGGLTGIPSKSMHFLPAGLDTESLPSAYAKLPATVFSGYSAQSWSMWLQFPTDELAGLSKIRTVFAMGAFEGAVDATQNPHLHCYIDPGPTTARSDDTLKVDTYWLPGDNYTQRNLASWPLPERLDDGDWHHMVISFGSGTYRFHLDGVQEGYTPSNPIVINLVQSGGTPWCYLGKFRATPPFGSYQSLGARVDRLRVYNRILSTAPTDNEIEKIHNQDIDRDGLYDRTESHVRRWRDFNADSIRQLSETVYLIDPFHHDEAGLDHDDDGLNSHDEQAFGYKAWYFDSDEDLLPDGWEHSYNGLDPLNSDSDGDGTPDAQDHNDGDTLTNLEELIYLTDPTLTDTDGDQVNDDVEAGQGSSPSDGSDGGNEPTTSEVLELELHVGDPSDSNSERWIMDVFSMRTGQRILRHQAASFGVVTPKTYNQFRRGEAYLLKLRHAGTDPDKLAEDEAGFYPDYDWRMTVVPKGGDDGREVSELFPVILDPWNHETLRVVAPSDLDDVNVRLLTGVNETRGPFDGRSDKDDLYETNVKERGVLLAPVQIGVDGDGDGTIEWTGENDVTSAEEPYRFWLNNDRDVGNDSEGEDEDPDGSTYSRWTNYGWFSLGNATRDLEDFFRLQIRVPGLAQALKEEVLIARLRLGSGTLAMKYMPHRGGNGTLDYLEDSAEAALQEGNEPFDELKSGQPSEFVREFPQTFPPGPSNLWDGAQDFPAIDETQPILYLLAQGGQEGTAELVLDIMQGEEVIATGGSCWIELEDIRKMYEIWGVGGTNGEENHSVINDYLPNTDNYDVPSPYFYDVLTRWADSGEYPAPDANTPDEEKDYLLFVHGWRMKPWEKRYFADTAYKRLWWRGYRGRFGMFQWPTEWTSRPAGTGVWDQQNYNRSDRKARLSAEALRGLLHDLDDTYPDRVRLFAHSMGAVVISEALRLESGEAQPESLLHSSILMQSASVAGAYDATGPEALTEAYVETKQSLQPWLYDILSNLGSPDARIPDVWKSYSGTGLPLYTGIGTGSGNIQNFHNYEDDALAWWLVNQLNKPGSYRDYNNYQTIAEAAAGTPPSFRWARGPIEYQGQHGMVPTDFLVTHSPFNFITDGQRTGRFLTFPADVYEILAFAAESKTTPLGASVGNGHSTVGPIGGNVDLLNDLSEAQKLREGQEDHSGQFRGTNMIRWEIWQQLIDEAVLPQRRVTSN